jgi:hypothetical protein
VRTRARAAACLGAALAAASGLLAWQARQVHQDLTVARDHAAAVRAAVLDGDLATAGQELRVLQEHAEDARRRTDGPLWTAASAVPVAGRTPAAVRVVAGTVDRLGRDVLPELLAAAELLRPERLRPAADRLDLQAVTAASMRLARAHEQLRRLAEPPRPGPLVLPPVRSALTELGTDVTGLRDLVGTATEVGGVLPEALGADRPHRYFVAFQTNAEARGTGGLVGAYGILEADRGRLSMPVLGPDGDLYDFVARPAFGAEFAQLYGPHPEIWGNTNLSPHFPYAARLWLDVWQQRTGQRLDGALAVDPVALSLLLEATGPAQLPDGEAVTAGNAVALTAWEAYQRFDGRTEQRKAFLVGVARAVVDELLAGGTDVRDLAGAVRQMVQQRRLLAYSAAPAVRAVLSGSALSGELPVTPRPFAAVVLNNAAGNKLDYHLDRRVDYVLGPCLGGRRPTQVRVQLRNAVPQEPLPDYVVWRHDLPHGTAFVRGSTKLNLALYATAGAVLRGVEVDGVPVAAHVGSERGHPVFVLPLELPPRQDRLVVVHLDEPAVAGTPQVQEQPLVRRQRSRVDDVGCTPAHGAVSAVR